MDETLPWRFIATGHPTTTPRQFARAADRGVAFAGGLCHRTERGRQGAAGATARRRTRRRRDVPFDAQPQLTRVARRRLGSLWPPQLTLSRTQGSLGARRGLICSAASGAAGICTDLRGRCGESMYKSSSAEDYPQHMHTAHAETPQRRLRHHTTRLPTRCQQRAAKRAAAESSGTERASCPQLADDAAAHALKPVAGSSASR